MNRDDWIHFKNMSKHFNKHSHIGEISLTLKQGQIFALCGGNGAGKSTFIKMITGVMKESTGEIEVEGVSVKPRSMEYRKLFSYMPDNMLFPQQLSGREVLTFFARLRRVNETRVMELLNLVGLYEEQNRLIKHYSKGMQQRLSFAQALLADAPLIILDEPTNGLDPYWFFRLKEIIKQEKVKGKTILLTSHVLSLVEEIADEVAFMEKGKIIQVDKVENLILRNGRKMTLEEVFFEKQILSNEKPL